MRLCEIVLTGFFVGLLFLPDLCFSQADDQPVSPILIDRTVLAGLDIPRLKLKKEPEKVLFQKRLFRGNDLSVFIISTPTTINKIESFFLEEFVLLLNGRANVAMSSGNELVFERGDMMAIPKGFDAEWTNNAGPYYHLELSVIATNRSEEKVTPDWPEPILIDTDLLSGLDMVEQQSRSKVSILDGVEMKIEIHTEEPQSYVVNSDEDRFIHILHGTLDLTIDDVSKTYYAGDNIILPHGFKALWESKANGAFRYVYVAAAH